MSSKTLESIVYYERYCVIQPGIASSNGVTILNEKDEEETLHLEKMDLITEEEYLAILRKRRI
jgi:hypothetical protein